MDEKYIENAKIAGMRIGSIKTNAPSQFADRQYQYYADENRWFTEKMARYSSDYVEAEIQGLDVSKPFEYTKVHIRLANIIRAASAISFTYDNYKMIEIAERQYTYIRKGAKVKTMGNVWLVVNPDNMSGVQGKSVIQRCDAVWNHFDFYGNVVSEPFCIDRLDMRGVDPDAQRATMINTGYYQFRMQYNENTAQLGNNSRMLIDNNGFHIAGYADINREYTFEQDSINMIVFRAMYEEPNLAIDDFEHSVAGGKTFYWEIRLAGTPAMQAGEEYQLIPTSIRTAEEHTAEVSSTEEHPISYLWESSDENVATVDDAGFVTGVSEGTATITCKLAQNPEKEAQYTVNVMGDASEPHVSFRSNAPERLRLFESFRTSAHYYENGEPVPEATVTYTFSGADKDAYTAEVEGNAVNIKCWGGSVKPLKVTAAYDGYEKSFEVWLEGI